MQNNLEIFGAFRAVLLVGFGFDFGVNGKKNFVWLIQVGFKSGSQPLKRGDTQFQRGKAGFLTIVLFNYIYIYI